MCCSHIAIDSICMVVKKYTWNLESSLLTVCCTESVLDEMFDGVGLAPRPI